MNIRWVEHPKFEADDIIASLATSWSQKGNIVYISSNDFDFVQLVSEKIRLIRAVRGKLIKCDALFVKNKFGIMPEQYVDFLSIVGDKTDNISGAKGIGPKIASDLLVKYSDIKGIFTALSRFPFGVQRKLIIGKDIIEKNQKFITMKKDLPENEFITGELPSIKNDLIQQKIAIHLSNIGIG
jgi:DNA polymerase-1